MSSIVPYFVLLVSALFAAIAVIILRIAKVNKSTLSSRIQRLVISLAFAAPIIFFLYPLAAVEFLRAEECSQEKVVSNKEQIHVDGIAFDPGIGWSECGWYCLRLLLEKQISVVEVGVAKEALAKGQLSTIVWRAFSVGQSSDADCVYSRFRDVPKSFPADVRRLILRLPDDVCIKGQARSAPTAKLLVRERFQTQWGPGIVLNRTMLSLENRDTGEVIDAYRFSSIAPNFPIFGRSIGQAQFCSSPTAVVDILDDIYNRISKS